MTPSTNDLALAAPATALPFTFGGFTVPAECRRIFITAELEPSSGDPRIQPTGFPDLGPVLYADPAEKHGLICLIAAAGAELTAIQGMSSPAPTAGATAAPSKKASIVREKTATEKPEFVR